MVSWKSLSALFYDEVSNHSVNVQGSIGEAREIGKEELARFPGFVKWKPLWGGIGYNPNQNSLLSSRCSSLGNLLLDRPDSTLILFIEYPSELILDHR